MQANDFVSINHLLAEATANVNDRNFRQGFSKGWYVSRIQDALQELAFDTFYQKLTRDYTFPTDKLAMEMPKNAFNIREIYLFNCGCEEDSTTGSTSEACDSNCECCKPTTSVIVHWKRLYNNRGMGGFYTAKVREDGNSRIDPFFDYNSPESFITSRGTNYYANIVNGLIMFSPDSRSFNKVRLVYNGMGGEIGDEPIVPRFFERAVIDYVEERFYNAKKAEDPRRYRTLWSDAYQRINDLRIGSWRKAQMRISSMNTFEKESLEEYISEITHK